MWHWKYDYGPPPALGIIHPPGCRADGNHADTIGLFAGRGDVLDISFPCGGWSGGQRFHHGRVGLVACDSAGKQGHGAYVFILDRNSASIGTTDPWRDRLFGLISRGARCSSARPFPDFCQHHGGYRYSAVAETWWVPSMAPRVSRYLAGFVVAAPDLQRP